MRSPTLEARVIFPVANHVHIDGGAPAAGISRASASHEARPSLTNSATCPLPVPARVSVPASFTCEVREKCVKFPQHVEEYGWLNLLSISCLLWVRRRLEVWGSESAGYVYVFDLMGIIGQTSSRLGLEIFC